MKAQKKVAQNNLRKFDVAGRIAETDEGIVASKGCKQCSQHGVVCMVFSEESKGKSCAFCTRYGRSPCTATAVASAEESEGEESMDEKLARMEARITALEAKCEALESRVNAENEWFRWAFERLTAVLAFCGLDTGISQ